jgi:hypothetical protein
MDLNTIVSKPTPSDIMNIFKLKDHARKKWNDFCAWSISTHDKKTRNKSYLKNNENYFEVVAFFPLHILPALYSFPLINILNAQD